MSATVVPFSPRVASFDETGATVDEPTTLTVQIEYLHHTGPHHRDTDEKRAFKALVSERARALEGVRELEYPRPIERWSAGDLTRVIDLVREGMPAEAPDDWILHLDGRAPDDHYQDGRALCHVAFCCGPHRPGGRSQYIFFSTAAGYAARVYLAVCPPASAFVPFVLERGGPFNVSIDLSRRALRALRRSSPFVNGGDHAS
jgi:hypothetical protein